jgi:hypothetical protein
MKFKQFLLTEDFDDITPILKKDCKPFLKEMKKYKGHLFFRGARYTIKDIEKIKPRKNRKPLDTPIEIHNILGNAYKKKFGWNPRTEGVFAITDEFSAELFGNVHYFFPIGNYKYLYNPKIPDLTVFFEDENVIEFKKRHEYDYIEDYEKQKEKLESLVNEIVNNSKEKNLYESKGTEVSFKCKEYYLLSRHYSSYKLRNFIDNL